MAKSNNWTREQTIVAFNVYCKIPFKDSSKTHPTIIKFANIIGRSPSALNMKVGNFGRLDPELQKRGITGLANGSKLDEVIWDEFHGNWDDLAYESEKLISQFQNKTILETNEIDLTDLPEGKDVERLVKIRVNQNFFRSSVLSSYYQKCCITGINISDFLVASHIIPWRTNKEERMNPRNGLCLNSIHDKAFDKGFLTITADYEIKISDAIYEHKENESIADFFLKYDKQKISLPDKFLPSQEFLKYHSDNIFRG
ncbi:HNH endonuclease [Jejuia pallidilutea]|jgi:putative restriction endonuclease|uniref:Possible restriction endonuclease n=1 Tax=Jejuia pallidilutea TaxID=504487 RepID=A0A090W3S8_9FLAO|nr:HNH endonuclease [Jejuia pallidilutea]GAL65542.1 possible restriction endonuclease [Jejuia pallidilutea]GAL70104.1 possible restriction endonuclease [Jejuia pallidilutea]GAL88915.1 possible restriction endonuclease [Jejuia pallidilutea]